MPNFILSFNSPDATLARVGGKGANLSELTRAFFAVPSGFLVTTDAYRAFVTANNINAQLMSLAKSVVPDDPSSLDKISSEIHHLFAHGHMPSEIAGTIDEAYSELNQHRETGAFHRPNIPSPLHALPVAVRSSATAEDLPGLSFAGQQETYLNIVGANSVRAHVQKCWGSLWTARALGYRARNGIAPDDVALAVVVQTMIMSEVSGVMFTSNPLTGRRDEVVIDASFGLGEAIVSGQVEPDHYVVTFMHTGKTITTKEGPQPEWVWRITARKLGAKALTILPRADGGTDTLQHADINQQRQALSDAQIDVLTALGRRIAHHYGTPQDIEWALVDGKFYVLQARPITSLYPLPDRRTSDERIYLSINALQGVPDPLTPLGISMFHLLARGGPFKRPTHEYILEAGKRVFFDITEPTRDPRLRRIVLAALTRADPAAQQTLTALFQAERISTHTALTPTYALKLVAGLRPIIARVIGNLRDPDGVQARVKTIGDQYFAQVRGHVRSAQDLYTLLTLLEQDLRSFIPQVFVHILPALIPMIALSSIIDRWLMQWLGLPKGSGLVFMRSLPGNVTAEMNLKLWATAQTIRQDATAYKAMLNPDVTQLVADYQRGVLPSVAQQAIAKFLDEYGLRAIAEIDMGRARWREDPASIFQTLSSYLRLTDMQLAPDVLYQQGMAEAARKRDEYVMRVKQTKGTLHARLLGGAIRRLRALGGLRETHKLRMVEILDVYRTALLAHGQALVAQGKLSLADDIFFVPYADLKNFAKGQVVVNEASVAVQSSSHTSVAASEAEQPPSRSEEIASHSVVRGALAMTADLKAIVAAQRAAYQREWGRKPLPRLLISTGEVFYDGMKAANAGPNDLVGDGVSPGVAEGVVHVVHDPRGVRLEPGEVLVCPATDPGWTPLFLTASALIMEVGGMMTHGAVVAREYGIPALVGVHQATTRLKTGQRVRVDGSTGIVTIASEQ